MDSFTVAEDFKRQCRRDKCGTILADPPWQFSNRTGKMAPEHKRLNRYVTLKLDEIKEVPVAAACAEQAHLVPQGAAARLASSSVPAASRSAAQ